MWDKLGEYVKLAVRLLMALATLAAIVKSISSIGDFVTKLVDTIALMASFEDELADIASTLRNKAPFIKPLWSHARMSCRTRRWDSKHSQPISGVGRGCKEPTEETLGLLKRV